MIKPIETVYGGHRFRSRLEARWAIVFDFLKIPWLYESEGVKLPDGTLYLPDFYLPDCKQFFEVKGIMAEKDEHKIAALIGAGYSVTVGYPDFTFEACDFWCDDNEDHREFFKATKSCSWLAQCSKCKKWWFLGVEGYYGCQCCGHYDGDGHLTNVQTGDGSSCRSSEFLIAVDRARKARFEHGEVPI